MSNNKKKEFKFFDLITISGCLLSITTIILNQKINISWLSWSISSITVMLAIANIKKLVFGNI